MHHLLAVHQLRPLLRTLTLFSCLTCAVGSVLAAPEPVPTPTVDAQAAATFKVVLPLLIQQNGAVPPPPPPAATGGIFLDRAVKTASASTAIDANDGYHAAYIHYVPSNENPPAVYGFCSGTACNNKANWREVRLLDKTREVQLALTPAGQPRLLIVTESAVYNGGKDYHYAACDANCTDRNSWSVTRVYSSWGTTTSDVLNDKNPQRSFALDPQGRPRFIYQDRNYLYAEPDHYGAFYAYCDSGCTNAANWNQTEVGRNIQYDAEIFDLPSLTFTSTGQPRIISRVFALNPDGTSAPEGLYYYECNAGCGATDNWKRVFLIPTGGGSYPHPSWDIELDANDRIRAVIFTGDGLEPDAVEQRVLFLWCDANCLNSASWQFNNLGMAKQSGESPDLELTAQGLPRIAYIDNHGELGYSWCNTGCYGETPQWQHKVVEMEAALKQEFPQAIPFNCDTSVWQGLAPVLDLDRAGNPRIAYDFAVEGHCLYDNPNDNYDPYWRFMPVWRAARLVYFVQQ